MKIVITHLDFSAYFVDRLLAFQEFCKIHEDELYIIEVLGESPLYPFLSVSKSKLDNFEYLFPDNSYDNISVKLINKKLQKRLTEINPDVLFSGPLAFPSSAAALKWAKKNNRGIVLFDDCHNDTFVRGKLNTLIKKRLYSCVDAFFCPSPDYEDSMRYWGFEKEQIFYGLNAVNNKFWWSDCDRYLDNNTDAYFVTIGRQVPFKNLIFFLKSYMIYLDRGGKTPLLMVGNGPDHDTLKKIAADNPNIIFKGFMKPVELKQLYRKTKALIVPSHKTETWGLVVNEALCAGRVVAVSSEVGCANTLVRNHQNGFVFDPDSTESIVSSLFLIDTLSNKELSDYGKIGQHIVNDWGLQRFCQGLYSALCFSKDHHRKISILSSILCRCWNGQLHKMQRV